MTLNVSVAGFKIPMTSIYRLLSNFKIKTSAISLHDLDRDDDGGYSFVFKSRHGSYQVFMCEYNWPDFDLSNSFSHSVVAMEGDNPTPPMIISTNGELEALYYEYGAFMTSPVLLYTMFRNNYVLCDAAKIKYVTAKENPQMFAVLYDSDIALDLLVEPSALWDKGGSDEESN